MILTGIVVSLLPRVTLRLAARRPRRPTDVAMPLELVGLAGPFTPSDLRRIDLGVGFGVRDDLVRGREDTPV